MWPSLCWRPFRRATWRNRHPRYLAPSRLWMLRHSLYLCAALGKNLSTSARKFIASTTMLMLVLSPLVRSSNSIAFVILFTENDSAHLAEAIRIGFSGKPSLCTIDPTQASRQQLLSIFCNRLRKLLEDVVTKSTLSPSRYRAVDVFGWLDTLNCFSLPTFSIKIEKCFEIFGSKISARIHLLGNTSIGYLPLRSLQCSLLRAFEASTQALSLRYVFQCLRSS